MKTSGVVKSEAGDSERYGNDLRWTAVENACAFPTPAHLSWITLRVTHIPTTPAANVRFAENFQDGFLRRVLLRLLDRGPLNG